MQKDFLKLLLARQDYVLRIWVWLWANSSNGKTVTSLSDMEVQFNAYKNLVRRALYIDTEAKYVIIRKLGRDESSPRYNAELLEIEFLPEPELIPTHYSELPSQDIDLLFAEKLSDKKPSHWIIEYIKKNLPIVLKIKKQPTVEECVKLEKMYPEEMLMRKLKQMENYKKGKKVAHQLYGTVYYTLDEWCKREAKPVEKASQSSGLKHKSKAEELLLFNQEFDKNKADNIKLTRRHE